MRETACQVSASADPRGPTDLWEGPNYAELIPQLVPSGAVRSGDPAARQLILNCVEYLKARGEFAEGLELCEQVRVHWARTLPGTHTDLLRLEVQYADLQRRSGRYREAEETGRSLLARLAHRSPDQWEVLTVKTSVGGALLALAEFDEAHALREEIWREYRRQLGENDPTTLQARSNLGTTIVMLGRYAEALVVQGEVLVAREWLLGREHAQTLSIGLSHARTLRLLGRYPEATSRHKLNARLHRRSLGENSPETLRAEHGLAQCLRRSGAVRQGAEIMRSVLERSRLLHGPNHPETLMVTADWATFQRESGALNGDLGEAFTLAGEVHGNYQKLVGDAHPYTAGTLSNLGLVNGVLGERAQALRTCEGAWTAMAAAVGPRHPWSIGCALNAAGARHLVGDHDGSAELGATTLAAAQEVLGKDNPLTFSCQAAYAAALRGQRRDEEADVLERDVLDQMTATLGSDHVHTVAVRRRDRMHWDFEPLPV